jgi:ribosomal protein L14
LVVFPKKFLYVDKKIARQKYLGLVVGLKKKIYRRGGHYIKGSINNLLILNYQRKFMGSRIFGPLYREVQQRRNSYIYKKIFARTSYFI